MTSTRAAALLLAGAIAGVLLPAGSLADGRPAVPPGNAGIAGLIASGGLSPARAPPSRVLQGDANPMLLAAMVIASLQARPGAGMR